ncbi:unnamed protein product [Gadus morhua 'NCC']
MENMHMGGSPIRILPEGVLWSPPGPPGHRTCPQGPRGSPQGPGTLRPLSLGEERAVTGPSRPTQDELNSTHSHSHNADASVKSI